MQVLYEVILPVFFVVALGYLARRLGKVDEHVLSRIQLYILGPALIFMTMSGSDAETPLVLKVLLHVTILSALLYIVAQISGLVTRSDAIERNAMSIAAVFTNSGFYGIPVCMLAFGEQGVIYASVYVVCSATIQATAGVYIASAGNKRPLEALATVFKVPLVYAIVLGRMLAQLDMLPPEPFMKMINLLGRSAIPLGLLLLGMQLEKIISRRKQAPAAQYPVVPEKSYILHGVTAGLLKIVGGFVFGLLIIQFFDFEPVLRKVIILQSAMPTAVNAVVYATEFDCRPKLVTIAILVSTLVSIVSISLIINWLG